MSRQFLVTKMVCAVCGNLLNLEYKDKQVFKYAEGEPTGADMVQQVVEVEPCRPCMEPVRRVQEALEVLHKGGAV